MKNGFLWSILMQRVKQDAPANLEQMWADVAKEQGLAPDAARLFQAIGFSEVDRVRELIESGIDVNQTLGNSQTALEIAEEIAGMLRPVGEDKSDPLSLLHVVDEQTEKLRKPANEIVELLKQAGAKGPGRPPRPLEADRAG